MIHFSKWHGWTHEYKKSIATKSNDLSFTMKIYFDYFADWIIQKSSFMKRWYLSITIYFYSKSLKSFIVICEKIRRCFQFRPVSIWPHPRKNQIPNPNFFNLKWLGLKISALILNILSRFISWFLFLIICRFTKSKLWLQWRWLQLSRWQWTRQRRGGDGNAIRHQLSQYRQFANSGQGDHNQVTLQCWQVPK